MTDQVRASHILLMYEGSARSSNNRSKEDAAAQIETLRADIEAGGDFADAAKEHSDCPSGAQGGDLGTFGKGQMVPEFDQVVFTGALNTVHGPVKTDFGYHLLEVTSRTD